LVVAETGDLLRFCGTGEGDGAGLNGNNFWHVAQMKPWSLPVRRSEMGQTTTYGKIKIALHARTRWTRDGLDQWILQIQTPRHAIA
jgi:hypothetical protein